MKIYNKFVESKKEPYNKSDIWFDGSSWKMYKEGMWRAFTLPLDAVEVKQNGDIYITGIGGFTGANSNDAQSVQEVINELVDIISQITIKVE